MALVRIRGMAVNVGEQTGDGRYIVPGGVSWSGDGPWPFAWLVDGDQHADLSEVCPQVGVMDTLLPVPTGVAFTGFLDDEIPFAAEMVRRMNAGSATHGNRFGVSIDPDDFAVQIVDTSPSDEGGMILLASSGTVADGERFDWFAHTRALVHAGMLARNRVAPRALVAAGLLTVDEQAAWDAIVAAAGDGDPLAAGGQVLFEDSADEIIARYTRLRIRGATACAVAAFDRCYVELDADGQGFAALPEAGGVSTDHAVTSGGSGSGSSSSGQIVVSTSTTVAAPAESVAAASAPPVRVSVSLASPPAAWFMDPALPFPTPMTITREGHVFGHIAAWNSCHSGYTESCVTPPRGGSDGYRNFHVGTTECSDGSLPPVGVFAWGIPHAPLTQSMLDAWDHYADSRHGFARIAAGEDRHGIWFSGAMFPHVTEDDLVVLRALSPSGDWRRDPRLRRLSLIATLAVNFPGYAIPRGQAVTAAGEPFDMAALDAPEPSVLFDGDEVVALVACGRVAPRLKLSGCGCDEGADLYVQGLEARIARLERTTAPLMPMVAAELDKRVR